MINLEEIKQAPRKIFHFYVGSIFEFNISYYQEDNGYFSLASGKSIKIIMQKLGISPEYPYNFMYLVSADQLLEIYLIAKKYLSLV